MKKKSLLLFPLIISLFGVSCAKENKIAIQQIDNIDSFIYINSSELSSLIYQKDSFVLVVGEKGCSSCEIIKPIITSYIQKYQYIFYWIEINSYQESVETYKSSSTPLKTDIYSSTILVFNQGVIKDEIEYSKNLYYSNDQFEFTMQKKITPLHIYALNDLEKFAYENTYMYKFNYQTTKLLDESIQNNQKINVYYGWNRCSDCIRFDTTFLHNYMKNQNGKLYRYEVSYLRDSDDLTSFYQFANEHGFGSYRQGKVPSIVTYLNGKDQSFCVYSNDVIQEQDNQYIVEESFYDDLKNKTSASQSELKESIEKQEETYISEYLNANL